MPVRLVALSRYCDGDDARSAARGKQGPGETATSGALSFSERNEMSVLLLERTAMLELLLFERTEVFESVCVGGCGIFLEPFFGKESVLQLVPTTWREPAETLVSNWYQTKANLSFTSVTSVNSCLEVLAAIRRYRTTPL